MRKAFSWSGVEREREPVPSGVNEHDVPETNAGSAVGI